MSHTARDETADVLASGFLDDPVMTAMLGNRSLQRRRSVFRGVLAMADFVIDGIDDIDGHGGTDGIGDESDGVGDGSGGRGRLGGGRPRGQGAARALWVPPGQRQSMTGLLRGLPQLVHGSRSRLLLAARMERQALRHRPDEPHWYLSLLAVRRGAQGRGHGSALLRRGLERVDADGLPAYLESSNVANVPLYERFGFELRQELHVLPGVTEWLMLRPARAARPSPPGAPGTSSTSEGASA